MLLGYPDNTCTPERNNVEVSGQGDVLCTATCHQDK